ncbi:MAG: nitroreductase family protein [Desulfovibrionaceae bacterium]|nr:nitroreductase family protein [Desulfovibrionaceae bacterium]
MDTITAIMTRRSVRTFTDEDVSDALLEQLLRAGMQAPSAGNAQPWEFVVLRERALLEEVAKINEYAAFAPKAALGILVCANLTLEKFPGYWVEDTAAAVQNILLAAHSLSLGAVWTGVYPTENRVTAMRALIHAPEHIIPMGLIIVGHPKAVPAPVDRFNKDRIHTNTW